jgi:hypothetical protein
LKVLRPRRRATIFWYFYRNRKKPLKGSPGRLSIKSVVSVSTIAIAEKRKRDTSVDGSQLCFVRDG